MAAPLSGNRSSPSCASATRACAPCVRNWTRSVLGDGLWAMSYQPLAYSGLAVLPTYPSVSTPRLLHIRLQQSAEDGAGEIRGQDVHVNLIPEAAVVPAALPSAPHLAETDLFVAAAAGAVV